jgi:hypothetical protein
MGELGSVTSDAFYVCAPGAEARRSPLELAGLEVAGAGQALLELSFQWLVQADGCPPGEPPPMAGEVRLAVQRREARLLAALLRRHLHRLPQPPGWMRELLVALERMDRFLRWGAP